MEILPLERPLLELNTKIADLRKEAARAAALGLVKVNQIQTENEFEKVIESLEHEFEELAREIFSNLTPYEVIALSRHPQRPFTLDIASNVFTDFIELHGDRAFGDDASIVCGLAKFQGERVVVIGHQKGRGTKENVKRNFGMPRPEGYRKAMRIMELAERFQIPIVTFIDTPGAYPGIDAEERCQSEAIAKSIMVMSQLRIPVVSVIFGEGGSGGALAIGMGNSLLMMQYSTYSVISPEGCASILWKDASQAARAADILAITAQKAFELGIADAVIPEPLGGAHWRPEKAYQALSEAIQTELSKLKRLSPDELRLQRIAKYEKIGFFKEAEPSTDRVTQRKGALANANQIEKWEEVESWLDSTGVRPC